MHAFVLYYFKFNKNIKEGITFTPFRANKLANRLFSTADRVVLLSATIIDHKKEMMDLGVNRDEYVYIEGPSSFDSKKSPIYIVDKYPKKEAHAKNNPNI